jgi:hypothetical protein
LNNSRLIAGAVAALMAGGAMAGPTVTLGTPLGATLGVALGTFLGNRLGVPLPLAAGGLLIVGAASLATGIWIVRRKRNR